MTGLRAIAAALFLFLAAAPRRAEAAPYSDSIQTNAEDKIFYRGRAIWYAATYPFGAALRQESAGFDAYPYASEAGYGEGFRSWAQGAQMSAGWGQAGRPATLLDLSVRQERRLGADLALAQYGRGALGSSSASHYGRAHLLANYLQDEDTFFDFGLGGAWFDAAKRGWGPSAMLQFLYFPEKPWTVSTRYQAALINRQLFHEFSAGGGLLLGPAALEAGYRALLSPWGGFCGPELSLRLWF